MDKSLDTEERNERYDEYDYDKVVEVSMKFKIHKRWYKQFIGFLNELENDSQVGHTGTVGFCADGDGDFRFLWKFADGGACAEEAEKKVEEYFKEQDRIFKNDVEISRGHADSYDGIEPSNDELLDVVFDAG